MADPLAWRDDAACRGEDLRLFYGPGDGERPRETTEQKEARVAEAKSICAVCTVRAECLEWHITVTATQYGVAGGLDEDERKAYRRRQMRRTREERKAS
ncbi:WhiB family transcriptional regulator [Microbispora bryophytorum]|uniref:WhiB family transcriptional regulator n=1 Tax=Microbispora bryophytorum TaxID=1460882 RepID=UPI003406EC9E